MSDDLQRAVEQIRTDGQMMLLTLEPAEGLARVTQETATAVHTLAPGSAMMWAPNYGGGYPFAGGQFEAKPGTPEFAALDTNSDAALTMNDDAYSPYYPGDEAVDWVGMSLYHWGSRYPWGENELPEPNKFADQLTGKYVGANGDDSLLPDFYGVYGDQHGKPVAIPETAALFAPDAPAAPDASGSATGPTNRASHASGNRSSGGSGDPKARAVGGPFKREGSWSPWRKGTIKIVGIPAAWLSPGAKINTEQGPVRSTKEALMTTMSRPPADPSTLRSNAGSRFRSWLLFGLQDSKGTHQGPGGVSDTHSKKHAWWQVMCLTGVDYFSTLGYQPAIAALAAGVISPLATLVLVAVTLLGALPVYRRVAGESHRGEGSIAMLERLLPRWGGKLFVLVLLGFAATDFMITMTLSAADATAHLVENPLVPGWLHGQNVPVTLFLLALLAAVFLRGFKEAIGVAVVLVGLYLSLNVLVVAVSVFEAFRHPVAVSDWWLALTTSHGNPLMAVAIALLVFPKLALGLSGFETGVAVMPQVHGKAGDTDENPVGRIQGTRRLLTTAAVIMSSFLITTSFTTVVLIPDHEFQPGGQANGRALAFIAHQYLGIGFGSVYDISTIAILWFAGASAMAGLLNLVPRYLPRYGMAPEWAKAVRPLVLVFTLVGFLITFIFDADVDAQGGAYATGVLVLMMSAAVAVTLSARRRKQRKRTVGFGIIAAVFIYTTIANIFERPEGIRIAAIFIAGIIFISFLSRMRRSFELHASHVHMDQEALEFMSDTWDGPIRIIAHEPLRMTPEAYRDKLNSAIQVSNLPIGEQPLFLEVVVDDSSDFETELAVHGITRHGYRILEVHGPVVANTIASVLLHIRDVTGMMPHIYFRWTEGNPVVNLLRFLFLGEGEIAPVTREVLREAEPDVTRRPWVHVG